MGKNNCLLSCSSAAAARPASIYDCSENGEENDVPIKSDTPEQNFYHSPPDRRDIPAHMLHGGGGRNEEDEEADGLGPLPQKWEKAYTENGESYFIDHNTGTSHWLDPRLSKFQKKSLEDCLDDELPYGWEKIHDPQYGTYFIDHVNRRTQYENPVLEAKRRIERSLLHPMHQPPPPPPPPQQTQSAASASAASALLKPNSFTRNPSELCGERLTTTLLKSSRGLGFTIVGGDDNVDEFLQIKSIVPNGPAWLDGKLLMGDILVYVNDICVLGFTHHEMVNVFQSIQPGETVTLEICRGYPLPFDPNDPNTEVVTTIAVDGLSCSTDPDKARILMDFNMDGNYNFLDTSDGGAVAAAGGAQGALSKFQTGSIKSDGSDAATATAAAAYDGPLSLNKPEILNIAIVKGAAMGFGFTIADSAYGQKVKKILDSNCCTKLIEGDYLLAINSINVKHMSHSEVVQVLKHCPKGQEAVLKIQRGHFMNGGGGSGLGGKGNRLRRSGDSNRFGTMPNGGGGTGGGGKDAAKIVGGLFRSKTPTADLYSTQTKEVLPIRPKTPLVDTRQRAKTPSGDLQQEISAARAAAADGMNNGGLPPSAAAADDFVDKNDEKSADAKSNHSLGDHDSINNDIPYMDPFPKLVSSLSDRLAEATLTTGGSTVTDPVYHAVERSRLKHFATSQPDLNYEQQQQQQQQQQHQLVQADYYNGGFNGYQLSNPTGNGSGGGGVGNGYVNTIYSPPSPLPIMAPVPTYHQETCYCFECQDYGRHQQEYLMQPNHHQHHLQLQQQHHQQHQQHQQQQQQQQQYQYATVVSAAQHALNGGNGSNMDNGMRNQKRINEYIIDRRKTGFSPLDTAGGPMLSPQQIHHQQQQQQQQQQYWKYGGGGQPSPGGVGVSQMDDYTLSEVTLERQQLGFGFRIVGGTEEGSQVTVGHIVPGGAADGDQRIATGDEILSIDGHNVVQGSHHRVVQLMGEAAHRGQVTMILRRKLLRGSVAPPPPPLPPLQSTQSMIRYPYDVIVSRNENEGFGFVISSSQYYGSTIGKLIPASPADRCEELKVDDRIIAVNRVDINGMSHGDVVNLIKDSGLHVRLTIGNPKEPLPSSSSVSNMSLQQQHIQFQHQQQHQHNQQMQQQFQQQQQQHQQQQYQQSMKSEQYYDANYATMPTTSTVHPQL